jgi:predicted Na+-dependent transporter
VLKMPRAIIIGFSLPYTVMLIAGFIFARIFGLEAEVAAAPRCCSWPNVSAMAWP